MCLAAEATRSRARTLHWAGTAREMEGCAHARRLLLGGVRRHVRATDLLGGGRVKSIRDYTAHQRTTTASRPAGKRPPGLYCQTPAPSGSLGNSYQSLPIMWPDARGLATSGITNHFSPWEREVILPGLWLRFLCDV
jgi:hypothetical protein